MSVTDTKAHRTADGGKSRAFDLAISAVGMVALALPMVLVALAIKTSSPGPVLFRQTRIGRHGRPFEILKFRTMRGDDGAPGASNVGTGKEARVTTLGRHLRKWKVDELPQLINVVRGEMSLVGPRPELPEFVSQYSDEDRRIVLSVRPGLTDFASIRFRNEEQLLAAQADPRNFYEQVVVPAKLRYCRFYVRRASVALDIFILMQTLVVLGVDLFADVSALQRRRSRLTALRRSRLPIRG